MRLQLGTFFKKTFTLTVLISFFVLSTGIHTFAQVPSDPGAATSFSLTSINPSSGTVGSNVVATGISFVPGQSRILIDGKIGATITASSTTNITFTIPSQIKNDCFLGLPVAIPGCDQTPVAVTPGAHTVSVQTPSGISNSKILTVTTDQAPAGTSIKILNPNISTIYRIGKTYPGSYSITNPPTQGAIVIEIVGSIATNSFKLGTIYPLPANGSFYFNIPKIATISSTVVKDFPPGSYKLKLSLYNKVPCGGLANCTPETLLASDLSDNFFSVVEETSPAATAPEHSETGPNGEEIGEIPGVGGIEEGGGESDSPSILEGIATVTATCAITTLVGEVAKSALTAIVSAAAGFLKSAVSGFITAKVGNLINSIIDPKVPVTNPVIEANTGKVAQKERSLDAQQGGILTGFINNLFEAPSLDAIGFCIANELIHYIMESTIQWVNSGFQGKPVFVENAGAFLKDVADREAGNFVQEILGESIGVDVCAPFRVQLVVDTIGGYTNKYANKSKCTLSAIKNNYNGFIQDWNQGGLPGWFELIQQPNNIHGARILAQDELRTRISQRQNAVKIELDWTRGYKNFKYCDGPTRADGSCDPQYEKTGTPGQIIESVINQRIGSAERRIEIADEFDELVSALVNQLVKIAVNEVLSIGQE